MFRAPLQGSCCVLHIDAISGNQDGGIAEDGNGEEEEKGLQEDGAVDNRQHYSNGCYWDNADNS